MKTTLAVMVSAVFAVSAGGAAAESGEQPAPAEFADLDTNADMYIDPQEFQVFTEKMREKIGERFRGGFRPGGNGAGDRATQMYTDADADGDGFLNETEFAALQEKLQAMREKMRQRWGGGGKSD